MNVIGILRIKNEARWIERAITSILPICDKILVLDDHSSDDTPFLCSGFPKVEVFDSPFKTLDECRDKNWLVAKARVWEPTWIVCIDGDEMLVGADKLLEAMKGTDATSISMRIPYLWDKEDQVRMDGVYGEYRRHSAFRPRDFVFTSCTPGGFHCGNVPERAKLLALTIDARLLHFGYMHATDRARKYSWYNAQDPCNPVEDCYRHIAAGLATPHAELIARQIEIRRECGLPPLGHHEFLPPPPKVTDRTMHAGPLWLAPITTQMLTA